MKNVILKREHYKDYGMFSHVYVVDVNYDFNEKSIDEILDFIESDPFSNVMIHANDITLDLCHLLKEINDFREVWFKTDGFLFEDFTCFDDETYMVTGLVKVDVIIDASGEEIDFKRSCVYNELTYYEHIDCPF